LPLVLKILWTIWLVAVSASVTLFRRSRPPVRSR
jgi:hypothetical protein